MTLLILILFSRETKDYKMLKDTMKTKVYFIYFQEIKFREGHKQTKHSFCFLQEI